MFLYRFISLLLTAVLTVAVAAACGNLDDQSIGLKPIEPCRNVQHSMGETCIPLHPQRVLTISPNVFANALALGIKPIATAYDTTELLPASLQDKIDEIELVGDQTSAKFGKDFTIKA